MEVEFIKLDSDDTCITETSIEHSFAPGSPDTDNIFGDSPISPRVGNEYQVEIPPMMAESECRKQFIDSTDSEIQESHYSYQSKLSIPILWIHDIGKNFEDEGLGSLANTDKRIDRNVSAESRTGKNNYIVSKTEVSVGLVLDDEEKPRTESSQYNLTEDSNQLTKSCYAVPELSKNPWTDAEVDSFIFGIYVFGKDFIQIKRFMENKDMGEIVSFYYGKFYRSAAYQRWSDSRKNKRRKCTTGRKIFTGRRQQELLSRLLPHVPEECQNTLLESYKSFVEWRTSLEEYVSSLKSIVSTQILIEAVAIGKGKKDLTSLGVEPKKTKHDFLVCPKLPSGQACSSLTTNDIVKLLTGGFRLSKARYNDIFWEAVWPRLLAKGWHSEQPESQDYISSKYHLVFIMPGVENFSKKKLVKGEHYFDSVSDVLSKVAHEPKLLKLEAEDSPVGSQNEQDSWVPDDASDQDETSARQRHCYLKPRVSTCDVNSMKFTVIDSSLLCGGKPAKIRELRNLPVEFTLKSEKTNCSREKGIATQRRPSEMETAQESFHHAKSKQVKAICDKGGPNDMRFTVVDTSLVYEGKGSKIREVRYLPTEVKKSSESTDPLFTEENSLSSHSRLGGSIDVPLNGNWSKGNCYKDRCDSADSNLVTTENCSDTIHKMVDHHQDQNTSLSDEKGPKIILLHQFSQRAKSGKSNFTGPLVKRRRLTACVKAETSHLSEKNSKDLGLKQAAKLVNMTMNSSDADKKVISRIGNQEKLSPITCPVLDGLPVKENKVCVQRGKCLRVHMSQGRNEKKHQKQASTNLKQINGPLLTVKNEGSQGINIDSSCFSSDLKKLGSEELRTLPDTGIPQQHHNIMYRRQSTRKRPLTIKALEALENGFLTDHMWQTDAEDLCSNPSNKPRRRVKIISNHGASVTCTEAAKED